MYTGRYQVLPHRCERVTPVTGVFFTVTMAWVGWTTVQRGISLFDYQKGDMAHMKGDMTLLKGSMALMKGNMALTKGNMALRHVRKN